MVAVAVVAVAEVAASSRPGHHNNLFISGRPAQLKLPPQRKDINNFYFSGPKGPKGPNGLEGP